MTGLGLFVLTLGLLSYVLPHLGTQLKIVHLLQHLDPNAGQYLIGGGAALFLLGLLVERPARKAKKTSVSLDVVSDDEADDRGSFGLRPLIVIGLLIGAGYVAHTGFGGLDKFAAYVQAEAKRLAAPQTSVPGPVESPFPVPVPVPGESSPLVSDPN